MNRRKNQSIKEISTDSQNSQNINRKYLLDSENALTENITKVFDKELKAMEENETVLDSILLQYYNVATRKEVINSIANNDFEMHYLDNIYDKILKKVYKKYKHHLKYVKSKKLSEEQRKMEENDQKAYNRQVVIVIVSCFVFGIFIVPLIIKHPIIFILICLIGFILISIINAIYVYFKKNLGD